MKRSHKVFLAIPYDTATKKMYARISDRIRARFRSVTTVIGNVEIGPSPDLSKISSFKDQNVELTRQFVAQISESDVLVADLTHNNPNVHIELGVALTMNKNILRVTGRSISELGFDIKNLEAYAYSDEKDLTRKVLAYLDTFFKIKKLSLSRRHGALYFESTAPISLVGADRPPIDWRQIGPQGAILRDGALLVDFEFMKTTGQDVWFGVYLRAGDNPFLGSCLVYVRLDGNLELAEYPGPRVTAVRSGVPVARRETLMIQFENNHLEARLGRTRISFRRVSHQVAGRVCVAGWNANVTVHRCQVICRDTIRWT